MKITDVKVEVIHIPMKKPFRIAFAVQDHSVNVLVKVMTDEGLYGIGEAAPFDFRQYLSKGCNRYCAV